MTEWVQTKDAGIRRRIAIDGEHIMIVEVDFEPNAAGALHNHPHEQVTHVLRGQVRFTIEGKETVLETGERIHVAPMLWHSATATESGCLLMDIFSPPREDFR
jgi:quercetin dioxygenase-like cupin family protein